MRSPTERFSDRVNDYVTYRPDYPEEIITFLKDNYGLNTEWIIADIGSGTGISCKLFLTAGNTVLGVEPNQDMRMAAEEYLAQYDQFYSIAGQSEATTLEQDSVDMVVAAQAFHWFNPEGTREEFKRILRPPYRVMLMWNSRRTDTPFLKKYEALIHHFSSDYPKVDHRKTEDRGIEPFFGKENFRSYSFDNKQILDKEGMRGRARSSSYLPNHTHPDYDDMIQELDKLFDTYAIEGVVELRYHTQMYVGEL